MVRAKKNSADIPLVVDLDGTLSRVDTLHEGFFQLLATRPIQALRALLLIVTGRTAFKSAVADHVLPDPGTMPINNAVLGAIKKARDAGRKIYLASAADVRVADAVAASIGEFDGVFATENGHNLKGKAKAACLVSAFGERGFDYIGNDKSDLPVWRVARTAIVVGGSPHFFNRVNRELPNSISLDARRNKLKPYFSVLRPHQWLKNILLALPALAGHAFNVGTLVTVLIAFTSFSLGASAFYLLNDALDLPHDRAHSQKRHRPLAAGTILVSHGVILFCCLLTLSIGLALTLPMVFAFILVAYFAISMTYSLYLKRKLMIDVVTLAILYGMRVLAGSAATGIILSDWLVGFCFFIFLSLALVKRSSEVMLVQSPLSKNIKGRGYRPSDLSIINGLIAAAGFSAVMVLALYINSPEVRQLYHRPELLWGICLILVYWFGRVCFLTGRGEMQQDPVIFAATDRISILAGALIVALFVLAL